MAEAFAVLSVAANIAQFTEYALALISDCREIYDSVDGAKKENLELQTVIDSIKSRHSSMKAACQARDERAPPDKILRLVHSCEPSIKALIETLEKLKGKDISGFPKLSSLRAAIRVTCYGNNLRGLKERLLVIEEEISREIVKILMDKQSEAMLLLRRLLQLSEQGNQNIENRLVTVQHELIANATQLSRSQMDSNSRAFANVISKLEELLQEAEKVDRDQRFLDSLNFEDLKVREDGIKEAAATTLDWIFCQQQTNYMDWLTSKNNVYWIQGKAGSGKSTLMKYVCQHRSTKEALQQWAGSCHLVTAQFFFWNSGLPMQKSQKGLLQALLYQIFRNYRPLIRLVRPERRPVHWTLEELFDLVNKIASQGTSATKYCFFIDGLDEYEGEVEDIVSAVKSLGLLSTVKLCVSSRPWTPFIAAFDRPGYNLVLQHHTKQDMVNYVKLELSKSDVFQKLSSTDKQFYLLSTMVATKAEGVWLWTFLVIRNLLRELFNHTTFQDVKDKLESLPGELEHYYDRILEKLNPVDCIEADRVFLIMMNAAKPLPVSALPWISQSHKDPWFAISSPIKPIAAACIEQTYTTWRTLLGNRCGDLLEIHEYASEVPLLHHRVDFLHRTVRDYLTTSYQQKLRRRAPADFKTNHTLCRIMLRLIKGLDVDANAVGIRMTALLSIVDEFLYYSRELDLIDEVDLDLIDEVDLTVSEHYRKHPTHWTNARRSYEGKYFEEFGHCSFYALAIQSKLSGYIMKKLDTYPEVLKNKHGRPLLDYALRPLRVMDSEFPYQIKRQDSPMCTEMKIIKALLDRGADVNEKIDLHSDLHHETHTVWSVFLRFCFQRHRTTHPAALQSWYRAAELLISHGASPHLKMMFGDPNLGVTTQVLTVSQVLVSTFSISKSRSLIQSLINGHRMRCRTSWGYWARWSSSLSTWESKQWGFIDTTDPSYRIISWMRGGNPGYKEGYKE